MSAHDLHYLAHEESKTSAGQTLGVRIRLLDASHTAMRAAGPHPDALSCLWWSTRSPDALGEVRNLPAAFVGATFHPLVALARAVPNLQDGVEESMIARVTVLAQACVAEGGRVIGVEPNTTVGGSS
jgi:hypothetical protein